MALYSFPQSDFIANCGTTDAAHAARVLVEKHHEKQRPSHIAFLDLEKAFDRVKHEVIWYALRRHSNPEELIDWVEILYADPRRRPGHRWNFSYPYSCVEAQPSHHSPSSPSSMLRWRPPEADSLDAAQLRRLNGRDRRRPPQSNLMVSDCREPNLKYNASTTHNATLSPDGSLYHEVVACVRAAWLKWHLLTRVVCNMNALFRFKSKVYRRARSVALHGAKCWPDNKEVEHDLNVMEAKMLRWMTSITRLHHIRNEDIRERFGNSAIADKLRETHLRWYGHVLRAGSLTVCKIGRDLEVP